MTSVISPGISLNREITPFLRWLNPTGDGSHSGAAITGNYSSQVTDFYFQPPEGRLYDIAQILITISTTGSASQGDYGNIANGLTNGVKLFQRKGGIETQLIGGLTVKKNYEYLAASNNFQITSFSGGAQTFQVSFDSYKDLNSYIRLDGSQEDRLIFRVNDNFTTLVNHKCVIRGIIS